MVPTLNANSMHINKNIFYHFSGTDRVKQNCGGTEAKKRRPLNDAQKEAFM